MSLLEHTRQTNPVALASGVGDASLRESRIKDAIDKAKDRAVLREAEIAAGLSAEPLFSVVIAVRASAEGLREAVDSVLRQSSARFEIIVVADTPSPEAAETIDGYLEKDARIRAFFYFDDPGNPCRGRNRGILEARGTYVSFLDGADRYLPPTLQEVERIVSGGDIDFVCGRAAADDAPGSASPVPDTSVDRFLAGENTVPIGTVHVRRDLLLRTGGFRLEQNHPPEIELWLRLAENGCRFHAADRVLATLPPNRVNAEVTRLDRGPAAAKRPRPFGDWGVTGATERLVELDLLAFEKQITLANPAAVELSRPLGIFVHIFYDELAEEIASHLAAIDLPKRIYISTKPEDKREWIRAVFDRFGLGSVTEIVAVPDYGTDVAPFVIAFSKRFKDHDICLKIHSKRSLHSRPDYGELWRVHLFRELMADGTRVRQIVSTLLDDPALGILIPHHHAAIPPDSISIGVNHVPMQRILDQIGVKLLPNQELQYAAGTMFWFRGNALEALAELKFDWTDFGQGVTERDGTLAHAFERALLFFAAERGMRWSFIPPSRDVALWPHTMSRHQVFRLIRDSGLFDESYYRESNPDVVESGCGALEHWVDTGHKQWRNPSPDFDMQFYLRLMPPQYPNPLVHYILEGRIKELPTKGASRSERVEVAGTPIESPPPSDEAAILESGLFDEKWYLEKYPEVGEANLRPAAHYLMFAASGKFDPGPLFDTKWYLERYEDVRLAGVNPLLHFHENGRFEGRTPRKFSFAPPAAVDPYQAWLAENSLTESYRADLVAALSERSGRLPRISIVMPAHNTPPELLAKAIESIRKQILTDWELCIADDCSTNRDTVDALRQWAQLEPRIKLTRSPENGNISRATNVAAGLADGDVLAFLDHDDELHPAALAELAIYYSDHRDADIVYSDDDKIDLDGRRFAPQFKPDWAPTLLCSYMYMSHLFTVRRSLFDELGGFRVGFEGSQDYDFALRAAEVARHVGHIPKVLYHWRAVPNSTAVSGDAKPAAFEAGRRAVAEAFARQGLTAEITQPQWAAEAKAGIFEPRFPDTGPLVSIVVPTTGQPSLLQRCLSGLFHKTNYQNFDLVLVHNYRDADRDVVAYLNGLRRDPRVQIVDAKGPFNFSRICNMGARAARGDLLLFLNDDTEVASPEWLSQMVGYSQMAGVGAVGARLVYRDGSIQHGGIVHGLHDGMAGHSNKLLPGHEFGYLNYAKVAREYSGVTAACLLIQRSLFLELGGLDESTFGVAYNDVDLCYRIVDAGYRCIYCPTAELVHHEGKSRGFTDNPAEVAAMRRKYRDRGDRWYNPNLSLRSERFEIHPYRHPAYTRSAAKCLFVSNNFNLEGAPNSLLELIGGLKDQNSVDPLVVAPDDGPLTSRYEQQRTPAEVILRPPRGPGATVEGYLQRIAEFKRALLQSGCEIVVANTAPTFWAVDAAREANLPAIWIIRESEPWETFFDWLAPPEFRSRCYAGFEAAYRVVFVADATLQAWKPLESRSNYRLIRNGMNARAVDAFLEHQPRAGLRTRFGISPDEIAVLLMGTVCDRKRQLDLVRAVAQMPDLAIRRSRFFIVGDRPSEYSTMLRTEWEALPPARRDRVVIVPETEQPFDYFAAADVAVCASQFESYPRVILEAMAFGLPIVTTPVWGIREQTQENVNALYYEVGDVPGLAAALSRIAVEDGLRLRLAGNARAVFDSLPGYDDMLRSYAQIIEEARLTR